MTELLIFVVAAAVGLLGSMLGIGGGVLLTPILTTFFGVPIKTAIGASIVSVIATSSAAGAVYVGRGLTHTRLAMILEIATTAGALAGGITAILLNPRLLYVVFGLVLLYVVYSMSVKRREEGAQDGSGVLHTEYVDPKTQKVVKYGVHRMVAGMVTSFLAGNVSGLLGIGGGVIKVPVMNLIMGVPLRAAIATSNFMIGITAATSATIYYQHGFLNPNVAIPTALGVLLGAQIGARVSGKVRSVRLRQIFQIVLIFFAILMLYRAVNG